MNDARQADYRASEQFSPGINQLIRLDESPVWARLRIISAWQEFGHAFRSSVVATPLNVKLRFCSGIR